MKILSRNNLLVLFFGLGVFSFFAFLYPYHLHYQEQYQMFLFTFDYLLEFLWRPSGFADYLGTFFTQFYFYSWAGALVVAAILVLLQQEVWLIARKAGSAPGLMPLSFVPSVLYWTLLCDENFMLGGLIAMCLATATVCAYMVVRGRKIELPVVVLMSALCFWSCGGIALMLPVFILSYSILSANDHSPRVWIAALSSATVIAIIPLVALWLGLQYPLRIAFIGTCYYIFPITKPLSVAICALVVLVVPIASKWLSGYAKRDWLWFAVSLACVGAMGTLFVSRATRMNVEEVMAYDFNVRMHRWSKVVKMADQKTPMSPFSAVCLNLALAKEGTLGDRMFYYFQNGLEGLIPNNSRDFTNPLFANEVYYYLGMVNTSQRLAFEAMESLPNYRKSARVFKRLAETNIVNGEYDVASKYLKILQNTLYYRTWATKALATLSDEKAVEANSEWSWLRKCRVEEDFLFSDSEKDMMLGLLFEHCKENRMAFDYLMGFCLLTKDLKHFVQYYSLGAEGYGNRIPQAYQEALLYAWQTSQHKPGENIPYPISGNVVERFNQFAQAMGTYGTSEAVANSGLANSYWFYLHFRRN